MRTALAASLALAASVATLAESPARAASSGRAHIPQVVALETAKLVPPDGTGGDAFGQSLCLGAANAVVVGAPGHAGPAADQGAVYRYTVSGTSWSLQQKLVASDGETADLFGAAVAEGSLGLVVGAPLDRVGGVMCGSVYVFQWNGSSWVETQKLVASDAAASSAFGSAVSMIGPRLAIGAPGHAGTGAVYVFDWNGAQFVETTKLTAFDGAPGDEYGRSVSVGFVYITVGAPRDDDLGLDSGAVYFYDNSGSLPLYGKHVASDGAPGDLFGLCVGLDGVAAGAPGDDDAGLDAGAAYEVIDWGSGFLDTPYRAPDGAAGDRLGWSVAVGGCSEIVAGANGADEEGVDAGAVHLFRACIPGWAHARAIRNDLGPGDLFGHSVAYTGDLVVAGSPGDDDGGPDVGAVTIHQVVGLYTVTCTGDNCRCPCNNGSFYWYFSGCLNSTGNGVALTAEGTPLVWRDDLVLTAWGGPPQTFGMFLQGRSSITTPFKDGCLCVGYPTERLGVVSFDQWGQADSSGKSLVTKGAVVPGETIQYQLWYRDTTGPCGTGSNLSNGIEVTWW